MKPIPLIANSGESRSSVQRGSTIENLYVEVTDGGKNPAVLYRIPGLKSGFSTGSNPCRSNGVEFDGHAYFVAGGSLWKITTGGVATSVGSLSTTAGRVSMVAGFTYIMIVDGVNGYTYDGTTFSTISDVDFPANQTPALGVSHCTYKDGFFIVVADDTGDVYKSDSENPASWSGLAFENADAQPDDAIAPISTDDYLYIFGEYTSEVWYNAGLANFPYKRASGGVISWGVAAPFSIQEADNSIFFVGRPKQGDIEILRTTGATVKVISTPEVSESINSIRNDDGFAFIYKQRSHVFYVLTFPAAKITWVYDITNSTWTRRSSKTIGRWRPEGHLYFNSKHYVGNPDDGEFYELDFDTLTDAGDYIKWKVITPDVHEGHTALVFDELVLDIEGGVGTATLDPQVMMRYSDDGGKTWSSELWAGMGLQGDYIQKCFWDQLGDSYQRRFEFSGTDAAFTALIGLYARIRGSIF